MTSTRAINAAADVICRAMKNKNTTPANLAYALDAACLLNAPEIARELEELRKLPARVAELEAQLAEYLPVDEQRIPFVLTDPAEQITARREESARKLHELLGRQREDSYRSPLHHDYQTPHDLPEVTS
ncbi:hypothetical protein ACFYW6_07205 [Streptomyces sp. NPDC002659]|uniref:hypothetical protein n=1 Tax=Streptomyces sp. NPDC002659 TaxID=3364656 RepID=UPI003686759C